MPIFRKTSWRRWADLARSVRRILGIDPGSRVTGYGVIDSDGIRSTHVASGCVRLDTSVDVAQRLGGIFTGVSEIIQQYGPTELAVEEVFLSNNASSALKLGQARGAAICAASVNGLSVNEYSARAVKQAVVGSGAADKSQVQHMVKLILNYKEELKADQADALAVALAHAHSASTRSRLQALGARA